MRVVAVKPHVLGFDYDKPWGSARVWFTRARSLIVEIVTDEGVTGWGHCSGPVGPCRAGVMALADTVIGRDPLDTDVLWGELYHRVKDHGTKGVMVSAISALDTALWDIKGKALGLPVYKLLGGRVRDRVPAYATGFYFTQNMDHVQVAVEEARRFQEQGFTAMKVKLGLGIKEDAKRVAAVRREVGDDVVLMSDASRAYNLTGAIQLGRRLQDMDVYWLEEPLSPEDVDGSAELCRTLDLAIAGGEAEFTKYGFRELITRRAADILQPDVGRCGGISEVKKIVTLAEAWYVPVVPHIGGTPVAMAASLHLLAMIPDCPMTRFAPPPFCEVINVQNPLRDHLLQEPLRPENGWVTIPDRPGLGIEIDREALHHYTVE